MMAQPMNGKQAIALAELISQHGTEKLELTIDYEDVEDGLIYVHFGQDDEASFTIFPDGKHEAI
jgi:hypothetical protein